MKSRKERPESLEHKDSPNYYWNIGMAISAVMMALILVGYVWTPYSTTEMSGREKFLSPCLTHPLGTDNFGRDLLSRIMEGAGSTFLIALCVILIGGIIGTIIGCLVGIEEWLNSLGEKLNRRFSKSDGSSNKFAQGFFNASLLYCVGAMAIVGSLNDGLTGDASTLYAKSILDGVAAIIFSSGFGVGALFSILPVGIYQGSITLLATLLQPLLTEMVIQQMCAVGYLLIVLIGTNLMDISKIKVGNMLPALFVPLVYNVLLKLF